ncbi:g6096 [Coccomyxa elongata]
MSVEEHSTVGKGNQGISPPLELPKGSLGLPLVGETLDLLSNGDNFGAERSAKHGKIWKTSILGNPTIMVFDEAACRKVLKEEGRLVEVIWPDVTAELVGAQSLNLLEGAQHIHLKRLLGDAFSEEAVNALLPQLEACARAFCERWAEQGEFSGYEEAKYWAWAMFGAAVMGLPAQLPTGLKLTRLMDDLQAGFQTLPVKLPASPYSRALDARRAICDMINEQIEGMSMQGDCPCCLATMASLDHGLPGSALPRAQLVDNVVAAAFGNASTGPTAAKLFQHLSGSSGARELMRAELAVHAAEGPLTPDKLDKLTYTDAVVQEILRVTPIVPALFRRALQDFEVAGYLVPKGWNLYVHTGSSTQKYNKDSFQPERWLQGSAAAVSMGEAQSSCPAAAEYMLPFGLGPRMCLGRHLVKAALKVLAIVLVRDYSWQLLEPDEEWSVFPVVQPKQGLAVIGFQQTV